MRFVSTPLKCILTICIAVTPGIAEVKPTDFYQVIRQNELAALNKIATTESVKVRDDRENTPLHYAAATGSAEAVRILLAAGADVNARNSFDITPLMLAVTEPLKVHILVAHNADVNARSKQDRTPLFLAAAHDGASSTVGLLLAKGADPLARDSMQSTPLMAASSANDTRSIELLLRRGVPVNDKDISGLTPLMNAAGNGNLEVMRTLIRRGADVNVQSGYLAPPVKKGRIELASWTPLMMAAATGGSGAVKLLLENGANPEVADVRGMTPLMLAVASDHSDPRSIALLLASGADLYRKDLRGENAIDWAKKYNRPDVLRVLSIPADASPLPITEARLKQPGDVRDAIMQSIRLLQRTSESFFKEGGCVSCHSQNLTSLAVLSAKAQGIEVDEKIREQQLRATVASFASADQMLMQRMDPPAVEILNYAIFHMAGEKVPAGPATDAIVHNIAAQQRQNGAWHEIAIARAPMMDGDFSRTAMAIYAIRGYGSEGRKAELDARIKRAAAWLKRESPISTEGRTMQLLGLKWAGAVPSELQTKLVELRAEQRPDGGWAQTRDLASDAYATGEALYTMHEMGVPATDPAYRRGVEFLLATRKADGSWHVKSRAPKFQPYFESGFDHGHDQWISSAATAWAAASLSRAAGINEVPSRIASVRLPR